MKKLYTLFCLFILWQTSNAQCTTTNATGCVCAQSGQTNCDLLPDMIVAKPPLLASGNNGVIEYSQSGNGSNNGRLRISVSTPNIGYGPMETRGTNIYVCGTDTIVGPPPATCPITGLPPKQLINQRIFHKNGNVMTYTDHPAGSMTFHPTHGHQHIDNWGVYTLRTSNGDPNPLNWPIVGTGAKLAFCLLDYGTCSFYNGHCVDSLGNVLLNSNFPNFGLGGAGYGCSNVVQGISVGYTDIYYQYLDGMWVTIPPGTCNGNYHIVVQLDPYNLFIESNENNNVLAIPYTLINQVPIPNVTVSPSAAICSGQSTTLTASGATTYMWSPSTGLNATTGSSVIASPATTTTYSVTGTTNGCSKTQQVTVTVNASPSVAVSPSPTICNGQTTALLATGATTYSWSPATGLNTTTGSAVLASPSVTTTYTVTGTTAGCSDAKTVTVTVIPSPVVTVSPSTSICTGQNTTLVAGGADSYSWSPATGLNTTSGSTVIASPSSTTIYTVTGTASGCSSNATVTVTVNPGLNLSVSGNTSICAGQSTTLTASGATTYSWSPATGLNTTTGSTVIASPASTTAYTVTGTSGGCSADYTVTVTVSPNPSVSFSGLNASYTTTDPASALTGNPLGGSFSGPGISGNMFNPATAGIGTHSITYSYTSGAGCSGSSVQQTTVTQGYNCAVPLSLSATSITKTSAVINWQGSTAPQFQMRYRKVGTAAFGFKTFTWTPGVYNNLLTGLKKNTNYELSMRALCTAGNSAYSSNLYFTTLALRLEGTTGPQDALSIYPNPTSGSIIIEFKAEDDESAEATIRIINAIGQVIFSFEGKMNAGLLREEYNFRDAADGIYFVSVEVNGRIYYGKVNYHE